MVTKTQARRKQDIKSKLMAAIAMLLVSSIMMVSSTYAWFTLSTAPEVTGVSTQVGANGNLEIALLPETGLLADIQSNVGDSAKPVEVKNKTWGNIVDLSNNNYYGSNQINLYPAALALTENGAVHTAILETPAYGADGRVSELVKNAVTATYDTGDQKFYNNDDSGFRAVGIASGMTDRQLDYRNARSNAASAMAAAKNAAANSLNTKGAALADIAIKKGTKGDDATFTAADINTLNAIINDLIGTDENSGIIGKIEEAYRQYIFAAAASSKSGTEDTVYLAVKGMVNDTSKSLTDMVNGLGAEAVPNQITTIIGYLAESKANVLAAKEALPTVTDAENETFTWSDIDDALYELANPDTMTVNTIPAKDITTDESISHLINTIGDGITVRMATGGGVYADIADHCGNYNASIVIPEIAYGSLKVENFNARMATATTVTPVYLEQVGTAVEGFGAPTGNTNAGQPKPMTEMYGYIIDLAFRTNAADSKLRIQPDAVDRIYDQNANEDTMGNGASMTFKAGPTDFTDDDVLDLMDCIRIIFFDPDSGEIYARAKLDTEEGKYDKTAEGITAKMQLINVERGESTFYYVEATQDQIDDDTVDKYFTTDNGVNYTKATGNEAEGTELYVQYERAGTVTETPITDDNTKYDIMSLEKDTPTKLSVLVYLDGEKVTNADVAASSNPSISGTMNLQFSSSATLVPMEYAELHTPAQETEEP